MFIFYFFLAWPDCNQLVVTSKACVHLADYVILIDSSSSISAKGYENFKNGLADGIFDLIPHDRSRLAVVQFSHFHRIEFLFSDDYASWPILIRNMTQLQGITRVAAALEFVRDNIFPQSTNTQKHLIYVSDGSVKFSFLKIFFFLFHSK